MDSILFQTYDPYELVVVDDGSTDTTLELLERHPQRPRFRVLRLDNGGPSRARNRGVESSSGQLLAFFDSDTIVDARCVEELVAALDAPDIAGVGGRQISPPDESAFGRDVQRYFEAVGFVSDYVRTERGRHTLEVAHNASCNLLYRRSVFETLGGFDESLWPGEDVDLDHRAHLQGFRHRFSAAAIVAHYRPATPAGFRRMMFSYGRAQRLLVRRYGRFRGLHQLPRAILLFSLGLAAASWYRPWLTSATALGALAASFVMVERWRRADDRGNRFYRLLVSNLVCWLAGWWVEQVSPRFPREPRLVESMRRSTSSPTRDRTITEASAPAPPSGASGG